MKHLHTFESFLNEADAKDPKLVKGADITIEMDDEDGDFVAGDYRVTGLTRGSVMLDGMGKRNLQVTFGALSDAGYTVNESVYENVSSEAVYINVITGNGQQAIQDFIDENGIDVQKLVDHAKEVKGTADQYKLRDMISGTGLGSNEKMRNNFIKKMQ